MRLPRGTRVEYRSIGGRKYRTVSRRQYDNALARGAGYRTISEFRRLSGRADRILWDRDKILVRQHLRRRYNRFIKLATELDTSEVYGESEEILRRVGSKFNALWRRAAIDDWSDFDHDGSYAEFLRYIGLRRKDTMMPVGSGDTGYGEFKRS